MYRNIAVCHQSLKAVCRPAYNRPIKLDFWLPLIVVPIQPQNNLRPVGDLHPQLAPIQASPQVDIVMAVGITRTLTASVSSTIACKGCKRVHVDSNRFDNLVLALKDALGPSSGLTSDDVNVEHLTELMQKYNSQETEWSRFALGDESRGYTRNLVDEGNGKSNLVGPQTDSTPCKTMPLT